MLLSGQNIRFNQTWSVAIVCIFALVVILAISQLNSGKTYSQSIAKGTQFLEDTDKNLTIDQMLTMPESQWQEESNNVLSYGMNTNPYWFKFSLAPSTSNKARLLEIDYAMLDKVEVWYFAQGQLINSYRGGDSYPFSQRPFQSANILLPVPQSESKLSVIIRIQTEGTVKLPLRVWEEDKYLIFSGEHNLVLGLFFGFMAAMTLSNLFFYVTTGSVTFLTYSLYVVSIAFTLLTLHGIGFKYLWPDWLWLQSRSVGIFATSTILFVIIFSRQLLSVRTHSRRLDKVLNASIWLILFALALSFVLPYHIYIKLFLVLLCLTVSLVFSVGLLLWLRGVKLARFYLLAWSALLISGFLSSFESADLIKIETSPQYMLMLGAAIETFMLAFALAIAYGQQRDAQFKSQELALLEERMARESQNDVLKLKEQAQEELEYKVQERTLELEVTLRELSETNNELEQQTLTDSLTGIRNRKHFDKKYQAEVRRCRREQTELSIVMLDIDHFKSINDTHGHVVGDEVIKEVAQLLKTNLKRTTDDACRYGGEEFALILPSTDLAGAKQLAESLRQQIESLNLDIDGVQINVTISAGIATTVVTGIEDEKELIEAADRALYSAKRNGRNQVRGDHLHARDSI